MSTRTSVFSLNNGIITLRTTVRLSSFSFFFSPVSLGHHLFERRLSDRHACFISLGFVPTVPWLLFAQSAKEQTPPYSPSPFTITGKISGYSGFLLDEELLREDTCQEGGSSTSRRAKRRDGSPYR